MQIKKTQGFKYFKDSSFGNIYILKRKEGYYLSKFQGLANLDDVFSLNGSCWFNNIKEINDIVDNNYTLEYKFYNKG